MTTLGKLFIVIGSINALLTVALGAFAAHGLKGRLSGDMLNVFQTGVHYHGYHALGLLIIGVIAMWLPNSDWLKWSGFVMLAGIILFSGSLYILSVTGVRGLGAITPIGGLAFMVAWVLLIIAVLKAG